MKRLICNFLMGFIVEIFGGCSSAPNLPKQWVLNTTSKTQNYFYCESCPTSTKLTKQEYRILEPDEPIIIKKPIIEPTQPTLNTTRRKGAAKNNSKTRNKKRKHKPHNQKQCIQWS